MFRSLLIRWDQDDFLFFQPIARGKKMSFSTKDRHRLCDSRLSRELSKICKGIGLIGWLWFRIRGESAPLCVDILSFIALSGSGWTPVRSAAHRAGALGSVVGRAPLCCSRLAGILLMWNRTSFTKKSSDHSLISWTIVKFYSWQGKNNLCVLQRTLNALECLEN